MIIPIRCFSCGKVLADLYEKYMEEVAAFNELEDAPAEVHAEGVAMDKIGLNRYCCRRMMLTHVDLIEKLLRYNPAERDILRQQRGPR